jgi:hypothetical protein
LPLNCAQRVFCAHSTSATEWHIVGRIDEGRAFGEKILEVYMALLDRLKSALVGTESVTPQRDSAVAQVVRAVGGGIGDVSGCEERLGAAIRHAEDYYTNVVSAIPGPVPVSADRLGEVPLLKDLFPNQGDLAAALGKSIDVKDFVAKLDGRPLASTSFHALLGMRRRNGSDGGGDAADGPFTDHTVRSLGGDAEDTRTQIRDAAMQRLLKRFTSRADHLRKMGKMLRSEWEADLHAEALSAGRVEHPSRHDFVHAAHELKPEILLESLIAWYMVPDIHLRLVKPQAMSSPSTPEAKGGGVAADKLPLLVSEDRRRWHVCLVSCAASEVVTAARHSPHAHRYILI